ncbi:outer membrane protein assembly factor BamB family protein [Marinitenerispora sediminis]|uniref:Pyrrolo-quinoline quinone repeat domain-containing protein n=1 Tax=Marinitenerispora sediminis TaxID=1931232 RepID=A0A368T0D5_9ACTN|nr:PQQ-binding-like beta-propeller repeat protein [Marinitenerispora sediminis]RCV48908.1 hypothetical protein DEF28_22305 [Marinitenerispora sediminis]RCV51420.1 hypothetical protein DEF23_20485 [Marinitenerispora sediminis]RCV52197.1 hypothetical protein DEF24_22335 [Marinitenerispora sediminis]
MWESPRTALAALAALALTVGVAGCAGPGGTETADDTRDETTAEEPAPPLAFAPEPAFELDTGPGEDRPAVLHEQSVFVADEGGVSVFDTATGDRTARADTEHTPLNEPWTVAEADPGQLSEAEAAELEARAASRAPVGRPTVAHQDAAPAVLTAHAVRSGEGESGPYALEVIALDAADGQVLWRHLVELPDWDTDDGALSATVEAVHEQTAALRLMGDRMMTGALAIDTRSGRTLWHDDRFVIMGADGDTLAGVLFTEDAQVFQGIGITDAGQRWSTTLDAPLMTTTTVGPYVNVEGQGDSPRLLRSGTGEAAPATEDGLTEQTRCMEDASATVVVCAGPDEGALALDSSTGQQLWRLPADTSATWTGTPTAAYGDLMYVSSEDATVVIDPATGALVHDDAGTAPDAVSSSAALVWDEGSRNLSVHHPADPVS